MKTNLKAQNIKVKKNDLNPETPEILAQSIITISKAFEVLLSQSLNRRAIVTLLRGMDGMRDVSAGSINLVLDNLPKLSSYYVR